MGSELCEVLKVWHPVSAQQILTVVIVKHEEKGSHMPHDFMQATIWGFFLKGGCYVTQADLWLNVKPRMSLNSGSSGLHPKVAYTTMLGAS